MQRAETHDPWLEQQTSGRQIGDSNFKMGDVCVFMFGKNLKHRVGLADVKWQTSAAALTTN